MMPFNPDIANAFFRAGLIEAWGRGIEMMLKSCKQQGLPAPDILVEKGGIWIRFDFHKQKNMLVKNWRNAVISWVIGWIIPKGKL